MADVEAMRRRGLEAHAQGDLATAGALYEAILVQTPDDTDALHYLGAVHLARGEGEAGLLGLCRSVSLYPGHAIYRFNYALSLRLASRDNEAKEHLLAAVALQPDLCEAQYHLGLILMAEHRFDEAACAFYAARAHPDAGAICAENLAYIRTFHTGEEAARRPAAGWTAPPLVSVVIPCVNHGQFVADAVTSCLMQTYPNIEVVVVEGGSTDGTTRDVVAALRHPRIRPLFRSPRRTVGDNRNFGIGAARGSFICCLDADDMLATDYIEKAMFCLEVLGYDVAGAGVRTFGTMDARRNFLRNPTLDDFMRTNQLSTASVFRRALWEKAGGFYDYDRANGFVHEDWNFWLRVAAQGARIMNINWEHLIRYRQHQAERLTAKSTMLPLDRQIAIIRENNADVLGGKTGP